MWTLVNGSEYAGRSPASGEPQFLEVLQSPLTEIAAKYRLSNVFSEFPRSVELLWCSGIVPGDFLEDTGIDQIETWRAESDTCWDINMHFDEIAQTVNVDFEGQSLLRSARGLPRGRYRALPTPETLGLDAEVKGAAATVVRLLDHMLAGMLNIAA